MHYEVPPTLLSNFDESVAGHVLDTFVGFVHEFKQFVYHRLEELPMSLQEPGVLTNDIHDIGRDHGFVVFSPFDFA
jgi:hypothetical protein